MYFAACLWTIVIAVIVIKIALHPGRHSVFYVFVNGGRHWLQGRDMYGILDLDCFRYSPLVGILMIPFTLVPDSVGEILWRLLNAGVYLGAAVAWISISGAALRRRTYLAWVLVLMIPLSVGSLNNGQSNPLIIGSLLATLVAVRQDRWNLAAGLAAFACLLKVYPIAVVLLLIVMYPRQLAPRFIAFLALGLGIPFLLQDRGYVIQEYANWFHHLQTSDRLSLPPELWYRDFRLLCHGCHLDIRPSVYTAIQLAVAAGSAALCLSAQRAGWSRERLLGLALALGCCWMTVFGAAAESCTYTVLAPTLAWTLLEALDGERAISYRMLVSASFALFTLTSIAVWFPFGRRFHSLGVHPAAGLLLLIAVVISARSCLHRKRRDSGFPLAAAA